MTVVEEIVKQHGPMCMSDTPLGSWNDKSAVEERIRETHTEISVFWPQRNNTGGGNRLEGSFRPGLNHNPIVYHSTHDKKTVVNVYLDENPYAVENSSLHGLHWMMLQCYPNFKDASRMVLKDRYPDEWTKEFDTVQKHES